MTIKTGNYITACCEQYVINLFQVVSHQILFGNYVSKKFKKEAVVHNFKDFDRLYSQNYPRLSSYDICFYRITETEATHIIQFLDSGLNIICGVETVAEESKF